MEEKNHCDHPWEGAIFSQLESIRNEESCGEDKKLAWRDVVTCCGRYYFHSWSFVFSTKKWTFRSERCGMHFLLYVCIWMKNEEWPMWLFLLNQALHYFFPCSKICDIWVGCNIMNNIIKTGYNTITFFFLFTVKMYMPLENYILKRNGSCCECKKYSSTKVGFTLWRNNSIRIMSGRGLEKETMMRWKVVSCEHNFSNGSVVCVCVCAPTAPSVFLLDAVTVEKKELETCLHIMTRLDKAG